jgi:hypothetical protein
MVYTFGWIDKIETIYVYITSNTSLLHCLNDSQKWYSLVEIIMGRIQKGSQEKKKSSI